MKKGVHFATVFAPTPGLEMSRILQAYAVGNNKSRFAFDITVTFRLEVNAGMKEGRAWF